METIEIIGIVIGAVGAVIAGVWALLKPVFKSGKELGTFSHRFDSMDHRFDSMDHRFDRLESDVRQLGEKFVLLDGKVTHLESDVRQLGEKVTQLDGKVTQLGEKFVQLDGKVTHLETRFDRMDSKVTHLETRFDRMDLKVTHLETRFDRMDSKFDNLPCGSHGDMLSRISFFLLQKFPGPVTLLALRGSPRHLSDLGLKIYAEMDGESFIESNKAALFSYISSHHPLCAFDVESLCLPACESLISTAAFTPLKDYLYNSSMIDCPGGIRHELTLHDICYTLSFPLRDKYLSEVGISSSSSS